MVIGYLRYEIAGFLLTTTQAVHKKRNVPIFDAMFKSYQDNIDSYIYGPVCVSKTQHGKGVAQLVFKDLLLQESNREGILFDWNKQWKEQNLYLNWM